MLAVKVQSVHQSFRYRGKRASSKEYTYVHNIAGPWEVCSNNLRELGGGTFLMTCSWFIHVFCGPDIDTGIKVIKV